MKEFLKKYQRPLTIAGVLLVLLFVTIGDWSRDFIRYKAETSPDAEDKSLRPTRNARPASQLVQAVQQAARRIKNLRYVGESVDGRTTSVHLVRTHRLLRVKDDVILRIEDRGSFRVINGESTARLHIGDLGRNPRTLKRLSQELQLVLEGAVSRNVVVRPGLGTR